MSTVYVDDITLSGSRVSRATQREVRAIIERSGLVGHKERLMGSTSLVTGAIVTSFRLRLPNRRRQQILSGVSHLKTCRRLKYRIMHLRRLVGQLWAAVELDEKFKKQAIEYTAHLHSLYKEHPEYIPRSRRRKHGSRPGPLDGGAVEPAFELS